MIAQLTPDALTEAMRAREAYHAIRVPEGSYIVIRVDGRSFTTVTARLTKPFDHRFHTAMCAASVALIKDFNGAVATVHSDEISLLLPRHTRLFDRELEKLVSVAAGIASAAFTAFIQDWRLEFGPLPPAAFDGRLWVGDAVDHVVQYFAWRRADAVRGSVHSQAHWALIGNGMTATAATRELHGKTQAEQQAIAERLSTTPPALAPAWQRIGTILYWEQYTKEGYNPRTGQATAPAERRRLAYADPPSSAMGAYAAAILDLAERSQDSPAPFVVKDAAPPRNGVL